MPEAPDRRAALALALALAASACGGAPDRYGAPPSLKSAAAARLARRIEPTDVLPADLDLVVRVDLARMRAGLGPAAVDDLAARALAEGPDEAVRWAMARADVIWLALRLTDLAEGDRVIVAEGRMSDLTLDPARWQLVPSALAGVTVHDRRGSGARGETARIVALGERAVALVTPVEVSSVGRVLRDGPDAHRGDPVAEGLVSVDIRARRLPAGLERRFPSLGALIAGVERVRATAALVDGGLRIDAQIEAADPSDAMRARRFLEALRDNVVDLRYADLMKALSIEQVGRSVGIRWLVPSSVVLSLVAGEAPG